MQTWVDLAFADGEYTFRLGIDQIREIETKCNAGIGAIFARTLRGRYGLRSDEILPIEAEYRFGELLEVIRQALIGGKGGRVDGAAVRVDSHRADELVERYVRGSTYDRMVVRDTWALAAAVLSALIEGYAPPKKDEPGESPATPTKGSTGRGRSRTAR